MGAQKTSSQNPLRILRRRGASPLRIRYAVSGTEIGRTCAVSGMRCLVPRMLLRVLTQTMLIPGSGRGAGRGGA
eukprot:1064950-Rhodomonas_salina.4